MTDANDAAAQRARAEISARRAAAHAEMRSRHEELNDRKTRDPRFFELSKTRFRVRPPRPDELPDVVANWVQIGFAAGVVASRSQREIAILSPREAQRALEAAVVAGLRRDDDALRALSLSGVAVRWFTMPVEAEQDAPTQNPTLEAVE